MRNITYFIKTNFDLCTGCSICQLVCSERRTGGYNPRYSLLQIKHTKEELVHEPVICQHCKNPYCLAVCPVNAIKKDKNTGAVTIDSDRCTGCGICMKYCYLGAIYWSQDGLKAVKCDLCGGDPVCVKECPTGALEFIMSGGEDENG